MLLPDSLSLFLSTSIDPTCSDMHRGTIQLLQQQHSGEQTRNELLKHRPTISKEEKEELRTQPAFLVAFKDNNNKKKRKETRWGGKTENNTVKKGKKLLSVDDGKLIRVRTQCS